MPGITLIWMSAILGMLFLGITFLSGQIGAIPSEAETVISQLARTAFGGRGVLYLAIIAGDDGHPDHGGQHRLCRLSAAERAAWPADGFLPRQLTYRGSRLVYSRGIVALALIASLLIVIFRASVTALIPLYAIGVFLSFTLSQAGMARRWWKIGHLAPGQEVQERGSTLRYEPGWQLKMVDQRLWRGVHGGGDAGLCRHQVPRWRLDRPGPDAGAGGRLLAPSIATTGTWRATCRWRTTARRRRVAAPPGDPADQRRAPGHAGGAALRPRAVATTSPRCTSRSTRPRPRRCRTSGRCGARGCGW